MSDSGIEFYGAQWCGDCRRAQQVFERYGVEYDHHDIEHEEGAAARAEEISGQKHIPVIRLADGTIFVEPTNPELTNKLKELGLIGE